MMPPLWRDFYNSKSRPLRETQFLICGKSIMSLLVQKHDFTDILYFGE